MACDSQISNGMISRTPSKIMIGDEYMVGYCGDYLPSYNLARAIAEDDDIPKLYTDDDVELLVANKKGHLQIVDGLNRWAPVSHKFYAIGSGGPVAMAAMMAGSTAKEACQIAVKLDDGCCGPIKTFSFPP